MRFMREGYALPMGELKWKDTDISDATINDTETLTLLNGMVGGVDQLRIGRQITIRSIQLRGFFYSNASDKGEYVFWAVVYDKQPNAAAFTWVDVYTADAAYPLLRNLNNRKRFKILGQGTVVVPKTGADYMQIPLEWYKKVKLATEYNATNGGTIADITSGSLYFILRSGANGATFPALYASARIRYTDM